MNPPATRKLRARQTNRPAIIEDLPPEMICELFKHLSVVDLATCSQVNKRWRSIYAAFKVEALAVTNDVEDKWIYSNRKIEEFEFCRPEHFSKLADQPLLSNLKQLALFRRSKQFALDQLQSFTKLVHLEIVVHPRDEALNHPELSVLVFHHSISSSLSIDCPKLRVLVYEEHEPSNLLDVKHPEAIRELQTNMVGPKLDRFKSVQYLVTPEIEAISRATLQSLPGLKKLHFDEDIAGAFWSFRPNEAGALDRMKLTLREFLNDAKALRMFGFQLRFAGLRITTETLDQIDFGVRVEAGREKVCNEYVYLKNYDLIEQDAMRCIREVNYGRWNAVGEFPVSFGQKFTGIETVFLGDKPVQDARDFGLFLKSLKFLKDLRLDSSESKLGQRFFDQLPTFAPSLAKLYMEAHDQAGRLFNFKFVFKLPRFRELTLAGHLTYGESVSVARLSDDLEQAMVTFWLGSDESSLQVVKQGGASLWSVWDEDDDDDLLDGSLLYNVNLDQLLEYLAELFE